MQHPTRGGPGQRHQVPGATGICPAPEPLSHSSISSWVSPKNASRRHVIAYDSTRWLAGASISFDTVSFTLGSSPWSFRHPRRPITTTSRRSIDPHWAVYAVHPATDPWLRGLFARWSCRISSRSWSCCSRSSSFSSRRVSISFSTETRRARLSLRKVRSGHEEGRCRVVIEMEASSSEDTGSPPASICRAGRTAPTEDSRTRADGTQVRCIEY